MANPLGQFGHAQARLQAVSTKVGAFLTEDAGSTVTGGQPQRPSTNPNRNGVSSIAASVIAATIILVATAVLVLLVLTVYGWPTAKEIPEPARVLSLGIIGFGVGTLFFGMTGDITSTSSRRSTRR